MNRALRESLPGKRQTRWSQKQRGSRRCASCGGPSEEFSLCPSHRIEQTQRMRERRASSDRSSAEKTSAVGTYFAASGSSGVRGAGV